MHRSWLRLWIAAATFALTLGFVLWRFEFSTDISAFLPTGDDRERAELSKQIVRSELSRTLVVTVQASSLPRTLEASRHLERALREDSALAQELLFIQGGPPEGIERALWEWYHPRRLSFVARTAALAHERVSDSGLQEATVELKRRLASPLSTLVSRVAPEDPWLTIIDLMDSLSARARSLSVIEGRFVAQDERAVLLLGTRASAFDGEAQRRVLARLDAAVDRTRQASSEPLTVESAGAARFAVHAEQAIKRDVQRISSWSIGCMLLLCLGLFRSLRLMLLAMVPIGCGMLAGVAGSLLLFGSIHGLTMAFGASLIGVCIDYVVHFYSHHLLAPKAGGPQQTLRHIWPGLALGAGSTMIGFAALAGSTFPGLREITVFALLGVSVALLTTLWVVPLLVRQSPRPTPALAALGRTLNDKLQSLQRHRRWLWIIPASAAAVAIVGVPSIRWEDNLAQLTPAPRAMLEQDQRVRELVAQFDSGRFVVAVGDDDEHALQINETLVGALEQARHAGELQAWQNAWPLLSSSTTQREVAAIIRQAHLPQRWPTLLEAEGFQAESFEPFFKLLSKPRPDPITRSMLNDTPLEPLVRPFRVELGSRVGYLTFLGGIEDPGALEQRVQAIEGAVFIDQAALTTQASRGYRQRILQVLAAGLGLIVVLLSLRYRKACMTLSALAPSLLAASFALGALSLLGVTFNLMSLTALLMVITVGVDYGIFMTEARRHLSAGTGRPDDYAATLVALAVAWSTTVFGFGLLALSEHPALNAIGWVAMVGVSASFLLAPIINVLLIPKDHA